MAEILLKLALNTNQSINQCPLLLCQARRVIGHVYVCLDVWTLFIFLRFSEWIFELFS